MDDRKLETLLQSQFNPQPPAEMKQRVLAHSMEARRKKAVLALRLQVTGAVVLLLASFVLGTADNARSQRIASQMGISEDVQTGFSFERYAEMQSRLASAWPASDISPNGAEP